MQIKTIQFLKIICVLLFLIPSMLLAQKDKETIYRSNNNAGLDFECVDCRIRYSPHTPISIATEIIPGFPLIKLPAGGQVSLANRYSDIDHIKYKGENCPDGVELNTKIPIECLGHESRFEITTGDENASFDMTDATVDEVNKGQFIVGQIEQMPDFHIFQSENAVLYTSSTWTTGNIEVEVDVLDNASLPVHTDPSGTYEYKVKGTCYDSPVLNHFTWTFILDNNIPIKLEQTVANPPEDSWVNMSQNSNFEVDYIYKGVTSCGSTENNYFQHIITEKFPEILSDGSDGSGPLFTYTDIRQSWIDANNIMGLEDALEEIFYDPLHGKPGTFVLNTSSRFTDIHKGFNSKLDIEDLENDVFIFDALNNDRIGYFINQEYRTANGVVLSSAVIRRVLRNSPIAGGPPLAWIRKTHTNVCP